jgi:hypothetical protein
VTACVSCVAVAATSEAPVVTACVPGLPPRRRPASPASRFAATPEAAAVAACGSAWVAAAVTVCVACVAVAATSEGAAAAVRLAVADDCLRWLRWLSLRRLLGAGRRGLRRALELPAWRRSRRLRYRLGCLRRRGRGGLRRGLRGRVGGARRASVAVFAAVGAAACAAAGAAVGGAGVCATGAAAGGAVAAPEHRALHEPPGRRRGRYRRGRIRAWPRAGVKTQRRLKALRMSCDKLFPKQSDSRRSFDGARSPLLRTPHRWVVATPLGGRNQLDSSQIQDTESRSFAQA